MLKLLAKYENLIFYLATQQKDLHYLLYVIERQLKNLTIYN